ncbi:MAG: helix-turn-helix transcriptional regulator [Rhizobiales bacterium]|nr:helix-turn-helix transcriptional regulator [Hyphomicrobiales bacterium]MBN8984929.1 helix-turn-helix transcriptional regulator [Hyphomicrobiales bacterium]
MTVAQMPEMPIVLKGDVGEGVHLLGCRYPRGTHHDAHIHRQAQLVFAASGTMQVTTPKGRWLVPPGRAVWVPARLEHAIGVLADIEMRTLYFESGWLTRHDHTLDTEFVVRVSPLLREAILALFERERAIERESLLLRLIMLELHQAEDPTTFIPLPREPRCRAAANLVLAAPMINHDIADLARQVGTSTRTLSRLFASETHLSFKAWTQRARIASAIERWALDPHRSIKQTAAEMGYNSFPAFCHAFRQVTGKTPKEFVGER